MDSLDPTTVLAPTPAVDPRAAHRPAALAGAGPRRFPAALAGRRALRWSGLAAAVVLVLSTVAEAGDGTPFLYALNQKGKVFVNGTELQKLTGDFNPSNFANPAGPDRWVDLCLAGDERWSLRLDGIIALNGVLIWQLPFDVNVARTLWQRLSVVNGAVYAIRADGLLVIDGEPAADYEHLVKDKKFFFEDVLGLLQPASGTNVLSLRADGAIFGADPDVPLVKLIGNQDDDGVTPCDTGSDGESTRRSWFHMVQDPFTEDVLVLRRDGKVASFDPDDPAGSSGMVSGDCPPPGTIIADMPFPNGSSRPRDEYADLTIRDDGGWYAVRRDGRLYTSDDPEKKFADLPGNGKQSRYFSLVVSGPDFYTLRRNGKTYENAEDPVLIDYAKKRWIKMLGSDIAPDLTGLEPYEPSLSRYSPRIVAGDVLAVPIVTSDVDTTQADLMVTVDLSALPGASYDAGTRTVTWPSGPQTGKVSFTATVDDGASDPVTETYSIQVNAPASGTKNKAPLTSKIATVQALVGVPTLFTIITADPNGDAVTVSVDETDDPFASGATFDPVTNTFEWTPALGDVGKCTASFELTDGQSTVKQKVTIEVLAPLY